MRTCIKQQQKLFDQQRMYKYTTELSAIAKSEHILNELKWCVKKRKVENRQAERMFFLHIYKNVLQFVFFSLDFTLRKFIYFIPTFWLFRWNPTWNSIHTDRKRERESEAWILKKWWVKNTKNNRKTRSY